jgi:hypothetical protein
VTGRHIPIFSVGVLLVGASLVAGADAQRLADSIDRHIATGWAAARVEPGPLADDAEFLRRVYLDIAGKIPPVADVRRFLADSAPDKRRRLIDRLLDSPAYITHFSTQWRLLLVPEEETNPRQRAALPMLEDWLRRHLADNVSYDQMVRAVLTVSVQDPRRHPNDPSPRAFFLGKETKPDELAARATRVFLGIRMECAQCHDHPFAAWKRDDFWSQAAFFAAPASVDRLTLTIPGTKRDVRPRFLDGTALKPQSKGDARQAFADWLVTPANPYFARAAINRWWGHFFGVGLVEPVDDLTTANRPSHPALLDDLAREFAASGFDVKLLIRAITLSRSYQLSATGPTPPAPRLFNRMALKSLTPEQLFDSLAQATGFRDPMPARQRLLGDGGVRQQFLARFPRGEQRTEVATSIPQALALMNGSLVAQVTNVSTSATLNAVANAPFLDTAQRIEALYLAALSRPPRPEEAERLGRYVARGGATGDPKEALADVFWALLNSGEFLFNH